MRLLLPVVFLALFAGLAIAQYDRQPATTPVPILKQINKHNEDGSYSYGFEAADGSYKIESKYPTGEVYGKYGFIDDTGNVREIEYGASRRGFEPAGPGINVPPPTLTGNSIASPSAPEDDGQYREDPSIYYTDPRYTNGERYEPVPKQRAQLPAYNRPQQQAPILPYNSPIARFPSNVHSGAGQQQFEPQYRTQYQPQYQGQQYQRSVYAEPPVRPVQPAVHGQPSANINVHSGLASYSVNYKR